MNESPAQLFIASFRGACRDVEEAHTALDAFLDRLTVTELAAIAYDWAGFWARPNQLAPELPWRSWGFLTSRRFGKTRAFAEFINGEAFAGRAMRIGFCAQNEDKALEVQVHGDSGLIECAPPWFKPRFESGRVIWPNGAQAFPFTPEEPGNIRGPGVHLFWASELQSWPASKRDEAFFGGILPMTSLGYARILWDATPKKRHPLIGWLLRRAAAEPMTHPVVRGMIYENARNLGDGVVEEMVKALDGTQRGREELYGEYSDDDDDALWKQAWIDDHRRYLPDQMARRVLSIDPAISSRAGTDDTGFTDQGLGADEQVFVIANLTKKYAWEEWGALAVRRYFEKRCDCVIVERNRGGDACAANIRAAARAVGVRVEVVDRKAATRFVPGTMYVKEINSQQSKGARAEPVAAEYKRGRVSHVIGGEGLEELESRLTTWVPEKGAESPNELDAMVHGVGELARLYDEKPDRRGDMRGIKKMAEAIRAPEAPRVDDIGAAKTLIGALGRSGWGSKL